MTPHRKQQRSGVRLVSTLNSVNNQPVYYQYQQQRSTVPVTHIQKAIFELFQVSSCCITLTTSSKQIWIDQIDNLDRLGREIGIWHQYSDLERRPSLDQIPYPFLTYLVELKEITKHQHDESVLFDTFNVYYRFLQDEALVELGEQNPPDTIIFDTTYSFYGQPIVGIAAVLFVLQNWSQRQQEDPHYQPPNIRIICGVSEVKYHDESNPDSIPIIPIWDISPFIHLQQLNHALSAVSHYGQYKAFHHSITQIQYAKAQVYGSNDLPEWLTKLQDSIQAMCLDLGFIRSFDLGRTSAPRLGDCLAEALQQVHNHPQWSVLEPTLRSLKVWTGTLTLSQSAKQEMSKVEVTQRVRELTTPSGLAFLKNLANHYKNLGYFPASSLIINEGYISKLAYEHSKTRTGLTAQKDLATLCATITSAQFDQDPKRESASSRDLYHELEQIEQDFSQLIMGEVQTTEYSLADTLLLATKEELHPKMGDIHLLTEAIYQDLPRCEICDFEGTVRKLLKGIAHPLTPTDCGQAIQRFEELSIHIKELQRIVISPKRSADFHFAFLATCVFNRLGIKEIYRLVHTATGLELERCFVEPQLIFSDNYKSFD